MHEVEQYESIKQEVEELRQSSQRNRGVLDLLYEQLEEFGVSTLRAAKKERAKSKASVAEDKQRLAMILKDFQQEFGDDITAATENGQTSRSKVSRGKGKRRQGNR